MVYHIACRILPMLLFYNIAYVDKRIELLILKVTWYLGVEVIQIKEEYFITHNPEIYYVSITVLEQMYKLKFRNWIYSAQNITLILFVFQEKIVNLQPNIIIGSWRRPLKHIAFVLTREGKLLNFIDRRGCAEQSCRILSNTARTAYVRLSAFSSGSFIGVSRFVPLII